MSKKIFPKEIIEQTTEAHFVKFTPTDKHPHNATKSWNVENLRRKQQVICYRLCTNR